MHVAECSSVMQRAGNSPDAVLCVLQCVAVCYSELQRVAARCSVLQCVAVCCSVLQCFAVFCSMLLCVTVFAVCCSVLQCVAARRNGREESYVWCKSF